MKVLYRDSEGNPLLHYCEVYYLPKYQCGVRVLKQDIPEMLSRDDCKKGTIVSGPPSLVGKDITKLKIKKGIIQ